MKSWKDVLCVCFETFRHSFSFWFVPQSNHFHHSSPNSPKIPLSLSLIVDEHTNTHLPHSYLSYKSTTIHVLTWIQITPQLLILLFQTTHSISLPLSQNNHFSCESSKSISSSLLSHSSHWIQECDWMNDIPLFLIHHTSHSIIPLSHGEWIISSVLMLCELSWEVVMMCLMRDENEREREVIVMKDDVDEMNNTCVVVGKHDWCDDVVWMREMER